MKRRRTVAEDMAEVRRMVNARQPGYYSEQRPLAKVTDDERPTQDKHEGEHAGLSAPTSVVHVESH